MYESYNTSTNALNVYRTESSSSTTAYRLDPDAEIFVNGVSLGRLADNPGYADEYLGSDNAVGNITLIDETESGSTATDGYYDYITVDYYVDAVVDSVSASDSQVRVYFKANDPNVDRARLEWDPQDEDVTVNFTKDDAAITYEDLAEYDVVSIAYDVSSNFQSSLFYDVIVAQNTVTGSISSKNTEDNLVVIDGSDYEMSAMMGVDALDSFEFNTEYTLYINAFGKVAYLEEGAASKTIGVVVGMYKSAGTTWPTVRLITSDGSEATYEVRNQEAADDFYQIANGTYGEEKAEGWTQDSPEVTKSQIIADGIQDRVVSYRLSSGRLVMQGNGPEVATGGAGLEYRASSVRLGGYTLDETATTVLDLSSYVSDDDSDVAVTTTSSLVDEATYTAYFYDRSNNSSAYRFVIITSGTNNVTVDTHVAVVTGAVSQVSNDNGDYISIPVVTANSDEIQNVLYEGSRTFTEGDVILYSLRSDGTISEDSIDTVISMRPNNSTDYTNYDNFRAYALSNTSFTSVVNSSLVNAENVWLPDVTTSKEAEAYFGPIYRKVNNNLELMVKADTGVSIGNNTYKATDLIDTDSLKSFSVAGDDVASYVVDYSERTGNSRRVYKGSLNSSTNSIYGVARQTGDRSDYILWNAETANGDVENTVMSEDINPNFAFVKVVDNYVTDVVYFVAD